MTQPYNIVSKSLIISEWGMKPGNVAYLRNALVSAQKRFAQTTNPEARAITAKQIEKLKGTIQRYEFIKK